MDIYYELLPNMCGRNLTAHSATAHHLSV